MASISVSSSKVKATLTTIDNAYQALETTLKEMEKSKDKLSQFWSAKEATAFCDKLSQLSTHVQSFKDKYNSFVAFINDVLDTYGTCNTDLISTINSITAQAKSEETSTQ